MCLFLPFLSAFLLGNGVATRLLSYRLKLSCSGSTAACKTCSLLWRRHYNSRTDWCGTPISTLSSDCRKPADINAEGCHHQNGKRHKEPQLHFSLTEEIELIVFGVPCAEIHQQIEPSHNLGGDENSKQDYFQLGCECLRKEQQICRNERRRDWFPWKSPALPSPVLLRISCHFSRLKSLLNDASYCTTCGTTHQ